MLVILDGYGHSDDKYFNAVAAADSPTLDMIKADYPNALINCSGLSVGLPEGIMGNSEVGHLNIGAGRIVYQDLTRISKSIDDKDFFDNAAFKKAAVNSKRKMCIRDRVNIMSLSEISKVALILLMFIGASPASSSLGTNSLSIIICFLLIIKLLRKDKTVSVMGLSLIHIFLQELTFQKVKCVFSENLWNWAFLRICSAVYLTVWDVL